MFTAQPQGRSRTDVAASGSATITADDLSGFAASACRPPLHGVLARRRLGATGASDIVLLSNPGIGAGDGAADDLRRGRRIDARRRRRHRRGAGDAARRSRSPDWCSGESAPGDPRLGGRRADPGLAADEHHADAHCRAASTRSVRCRLPRSPQTITGVTVTGSSAAPTRRVGRADGAAGARRPPPPPRRR